MNIGEERTIGSEHDTPCRVFELSCRPCASWLAEPTMQLIDLQTHYPCKYLGVQSDEIRRRSKDDDFGLAFGGLDLYL